MLGTARLARRSSVWLAALVGWPGVWSEASPPNLRVAAEGVLVGGEPSTEVDWNELRALGVRTVVAVDGMRPDLAAAERIGARLVHVPIGYDAVPAEAQAQLAKVARDEPGPVYVYCHHGRHRGPAAAAIVARASGRMDAAQAIELLEQAGTNPDYGGLWRDVRAFNPRRVDTAGVQLVASAEVEPMALAMGQLDRAWDAWRAAPDAAARREAMATLEQGLKESRRASEADSAARDLIARFDQAAAELKHLDGADEANRSSAIKAMSDTCTACHAAHRD